MPNFCSGIHVLVKKENKYLIIQRSNKDKEDPNCWDLPGGGIKFGEQPFAATIRETKEEAGINIKIIKPLILYALPYRGKWSLESIVLASYLSGKIKLSKEHLNYKWVNNKELLKIKPKSIHLISLIQLFNPR